MWLQDNTIADSPMVELLTSMQHMLEQARVRSVGVGGSQDLHQLVIIVADGRFHEKESLQRVVAVSYLAACLHDTEHMMFDISLQSNRILFWP